QLLKEMVDEKATHATLEVSSHALVQERVRGLSFHAAVFTNLPRDHLDFSVGFEGYFEAKKRLFTEHLHKEGFAIVNLDDEHGESLARSLRGPRCHTFGLTPGADYHPENLEVSLRGVLFVCATPFGPATIDSPLV